MALGCSRYPLHITSVATLVIRIKPMWSSQLLYRVIMHRSASTLGFSINFLCPAADMQILHPHPKIWNYKGISEVSAHMCRFQVELFFNGVMPIGSAKAVRVLKIPHSTVLCDLLIQGVLYFNDLEEAKSTGNIRLLKCASFKFAILGSFTEEEMEMVRTTCCMILVTLRISFLTLTYIWNSSLRYLRTKMKKNGAVDKMTLQALRNGVGYRLAMKAHF